MRLKSSKGSCEATITNVFNGNWSSCSGESFLFGVDVWDDEAAFASWRFCKNVGNICINETKQNPPFCSCSSTSFVEQFSGPGKAGCRHCRCLVKTSWTRLLLACKRRMCERLVLSGWGCCTAGLGVWRGIWCGAAEDEWGGTRNVGGVFFVVQGVALVWLLGYLNVRIP